MRTELEGSERTRMKIQSIEPTPSPNTMKILLDEALSAGKNYNYKAKDVEEAPSFIQGILAIDGVTGVYHVADFLAVERHPKHDWKEILPKVREALGENVAETESSQQVDEHFGEIQVSVLTFKDIPIQVKLQSADEEKRFALSDRFQQSMMAAQLDGDNVVFLRKWVEKGLRFGDDLENIGRDCVEEVEASYPSERLERLVRFAKNPDAKEALRPKRLKLTPQDLDSEDWKKRYEKLEQMDDPTLDDLPVLEKALEDEKASIRRLAVVYLGMIEDRSVLPYLYKGLQDKTVTVRRTAGDCLSDLGFPEAMDEMAKALQDKNKLVRWRAAMFLYEVGDESVLPALETAKDDPEFEVSLQVQIAIERIAGGQEAKGSVWKQMTEARKQVTEHKE